MGVRKKDLQVIQEIQRVEEDYKIQYCWNKRINSQRSDAMVPNRKFWSLLSILRNDKC